MKVYGLLATALFLCGYLDTGICIPTYVSCPEAGQHDTSTFFPHERNCTEYYECVNGKSLIKHCPSGEHWNPSLNICDWPWKAGCKLASGRSVSTREGSIVCPPGPVPECPVPDPELSQFFPHPYDCEWFFHCSNGVAYCKICPSGLNWNPALDVCDWPWQAGCTSKPPSGCPEAQGFSCPVPQPDYDVYFADPSNCSAFYQCSSGVVTQQFCPSGYLFDRALKVCNVAEKVGCCSGVTTSGPGITTTSSGSDITATSSGSDITTSGQVSTTSVPEETTAVPSTDPESSEESSEETNEDNSSSSSSEEEEEEEDDDDDDDDDDEDLV